MKKIPLIMIFSTILALTFTGCLSGAAGSNSGTDGTSSSNYTTIKMYVNAPTSNDFIYTLLATTEYKNLDSSYDGTVTISYRGTPTISSITAPITKYIAYCEGVRQAIQQDTGRKCTVTYNSSTDGSGYALDFSNTTVAVRSLLQVAVFGITSVHAKYQY